MASYALVNGICIFKMYTEFWLPSSKHTHTHIFRYYLWFVNYRLVNFHVLIKLVFHQSMVHLGVDWAMTSSVNKFSIGLDWRVCCIKRQKFQLLAACQLYVGLVSNFFWPNDLLKLQTMQCNAMHSVRMSRSAFHEIFWWHCD